MSLAKQVILFVIDGLCPDALPQTPTPALDSLIAQGAHTRQAQSVMPSVTLPCHASMFCAVPPERHGVTDNVWTPSQPPVPSIIEIAHQAGLGTAAFYTWEPLRDLAPPGALNVAYLYRLEENTGEQDLKIAAAAAEIIATHNLGFVFVYLAAPDTIGHLHGWMSPPYLEAVSLADKAIGLVLKSLRSDTACLVLADHGGHGMEHGTDLPEDLTIPWIVSGPGIRRGHEIRSAVGITDTAPTIAHLLGLPAPSEWNGRVVEEALML